MCSEREELPSRLELERKWESSKSEKLGGRFLERTSGTNCEALPSRLVSEAARLKEEETEKTFAEIIKQTELQIQQMEVTIQSRVNEVRENDKEDYALELRTTKLNMEERSVQQRQYIDEQEKKLQIMTQKNQKLHR